jgi:hypothetical protein
MKKILKDSEGSNAITKSTDIPPTESWFSNIIEFEFPQNQSKLIRCWNDIGLDTTVVAIGADYQMEF